MSVRAIEAATAGWPAPVRDQVPVNVTVPEPVGMIVAWAALFPETMATAPLAVQAYEATVRPQEAALPLASSTALLPAAMAGSTTAAIGACAACTAV